MQRSMIRDRWAVVDEINARMDKHAQKVERAKARMRAAIARGAARAAQAVQSHLSPLPIRDAARTV